MTRVLFICSLNRLRSPTAEAVFSDWPGVEAMSAGTDPHAETPVTAELLEWADVVLCMEDRHRARLNQLHGPALRRKRIGVLKVPDRDSYMDPALVRMLKKKVPPHLCR